MDKLLPCPYCGHKAVVERDEHNFLWVVCDSDTCYGRAGCAFDSETAVAAWNKRTPDYQELARELVEVIAECQPSCGTCEYDNTNDCDFHGERCRKEVWLDGVALAKARAAGLLEEKDE